MAGMSLKGKGIPTLLYTSTEENSSNLLLQEGIQKRKTLVSACILEMSDEYSDRGRTELCGFSFWPRVIELANNPINSQILRTIKVSIHL